MCPNQTQTVKASVILIMNCVIMNCGKGLGLHYLMTATQKKIKVMIVEFAITSRPARSVIGLHRGNMQVKRVRCSYVSA